MRATLERKKEQHPATLLRMKPEDRNRALIEAQPLLADVERRLLRIGGERVVLLPGELYPGDLLKKGRLTRTKPDESNVRFIQGEPCRCHENSARYWLQDTEGRKIVTGYALSHGNIWRQHTWIRDGKLIIESTAMREAYFGYELTPDQAGAFAGANVPELISFFEHFKRYHPLGK